MEVEFLFWLAFGVGAPLAGVLALLGGILYILFGIPDAADECSRSNVTESSPDGHPGDRSK